MELSFYVAYNKTYGHINKGIFMKCPQCKKLFNVKGPEKCCSPKCKLLYYKTVNENGCWLYKSSTSGAYSKIRIDKKWYLAHRKSYEIFKGEITLNKWVCHTCDTPKCINPDHLFLGTPTDNMRDARQKNRIVRGEKSHLSLFTDIQVKEMRLLNKEGMSYDRLSRIFNCSIVYISGIIKNKLRMEN